MEGSGAREWCKVVVQGSDNKTGTIGVGEERSLTVDPARLYRPQWLVLTPVLFSMENEREMTERRERRGEERGERRREEGGEDERSGGEKSLEKKERRGERRGGGEKKRIGEKNREVDEKRRTRGERRGDSETHVNRGDT